MVRDLEEQLEAVSRSEHVAQQKIRQLEDEIKTLKMMEEVFNVWLLVWVRV